MSFSIKRFVCVFFVLEMQAIIIRSNSLTTLTTWNQWWYLNFSRYGFPNCHTASAASHFFLNILPFSVFLAFSHLMLTPKLTMTTPMLTVAASNNNQKHARQTHHTKCTFTHTHKHNLLVASNNVQFYSCSLWKTFYIPFMFRYLMTSCRWLLWLCFVCAFSHKHTHTHTRCLSLYTLLTVLILYLYFFPLEKLIHNLASARAEWKEKQQQSYAHMPHSSDGHIPIIFYKHSMASNWNELYFVWSVLWKSHACTKFHKQVHAFDSFRANVTTTTVAATLENHKSEFF